MNTQSGATITQATEVASNTGTPTLCSIPSLTCGGSGWRRVAFINMTDPNQSCPQRLNLTGYSIRSCGHMGTGSSSVTIPVSGHQYSNVCGRVTAYRLGWNLGFNGYNTDGHTPLKVPMWMESALHTGHQDPTSGHWLVVYLAEPVVTLTHTLSVLVILITL